MRVADFEFPLPRELVAERPPKNRGSSRLFVLHKNRVIEHKKFSDLSAYLVAGDLLILNNSKVFPARLRGYKESGGRVDILLVKEKEKNVWEVLSRGRFSGTVSISEDLQAELYNGRTAYFRYSGNFMDIVWKCGTMPLPPYIRRHPDEADKKRYQTVYARETGSLAAPTAGLHFSNGLLTEITSRGIVVRELTLHVGIGTFKPIKTETVEEHFMEPEHFEIEMDLISEIEKTKALGKRIIAVGTTTARALEGYMSTRCKVASQNGKYQGTTDIFIYPGYKFKVVDSLITNFHLPCSTPLMLASALCGWKNLKKSYEEAIAAKYRFFSYGDAMLIL